MNQTRQNKSIGPEPRVCLIEGGPHDGTPRIHIPAGVWTLYSSKKYGCHFESITQKNLYNRKISSPRGKMLGGSSSMNSMIYIRGHRSDYDGWRDLGCTGWGYADVLSFFMKFEADQIGCDPRYHGKTGELHINKAQDPNIVS